MALARDMAEVCPDAYLLSYSNPMAMLPWAVYEGSAFTRVFGLCHSVRDTQAFLTQLTGADPERVRFLTAGFNHQAFVLRFEQDGESLYPRLAEVIDASPELQRRVRVEIYRRFGYFPTESSEHSAEYVPWFMRHDDQIEEFRIFVGDYLERSEENLRELEELRRALDSDDPLDLDAGQRAGVAVHPRAGDRHRARAAREHPQRRADRQPAGRVLRRGALHRRRGGAKPVPGRRAAAAARRAEPDLPQRGGADRPGRAGGSRDRVYQAALLDPNTAATLTTAQTVAMCDDLFAAHRDLLPAGLAGADHEDRGWPLATAVALHAHLAHRLASPGTAASAALPLGAFGAGIAPPVHHGTLRDLGPSPGTARRSPPPGCAGTRPGCRAA